MHIEFLFCVALFIPTSLAAQPSIKLTFSVEDSYFQPDTPLDIHCELLNPAGSDDTAQLWYIDLKTGRQIAISRAFINQPPDDAPEVFKHNRNKRIEYPKKNQLKFRHLTLEDSARYECNCPDCEEPVEKKTRDLLVMKIVEPQWYIEPGTELKEKESATFKCVADDFFPYSSHQIFERHHDITNKGHATPPTTNTYPQSFSWEATLSPTPEWHNTTIRCTVTQGNTERHAIKYLNVLFAPRFLTCEPRQYINASLEQATIECTYSGNPKPDVQWFRASSGTPLIEEPGISIKIEDRSHGQYHSVVTFNRDKLVSIPITTTTRDPSTSSESSASSAVNAENYYQQLLNGGFTVKLMLDNVESNKRNITIVSDAKQARSNPADSSSTLFLEYRSTSILLFFLTTFLYFMQHP